MKKLTALLLALVMLLSLTACGAKVDAFHSYCRLTFCQFLRHPLPMRRLPLLRPKTAWTPTRRSPCICTALQTSLMLVLKARSTWSPASRCPVTMN